MSGETVKQASFGGREVYNQTPAERLEECVIITDVIDSLFGCPLDPSGSAGCTTQFDSQGTYMQRQFRYMEGDGLSGVVWPLTEKVFTIMYTRRTSAPYSREAYTISTKTFVRQAGVTNVGMQNSYTIEYLGAVRTSAVSSIEQPNFTEPCEPNMVTREATPYDHEQLFDELAELQNAIDASVREQRIVATLNKRPE